MQNHLLDEAADPLSATEASQNAHLFTAESHIDKAAEALRGMKFRSLTDEDLASILPTMNALKQHYAAPFATRDPGEAFIEDLYDWFFPSGETTAKLAYRQLSDSLARSPDKLACLDVIARLKADQARYGLEASEVMIKTVNKTRIKAYITDCKAHASEFTVSEQVKIMLASAKMLVKQFIRGSERRKQRSGVNEATMPAPPAAMRRYRVEKVGMSAHDLSSLQKPAANTTMDPKSAEPASYAQWLDLIITLFPTMTMNESTDMINSLHNMVESTLGGPLTKAEFSTLIGNSMISKRMAMAKQIGLNESGSPESHEAMLMGMAKIMCADFEERTATVYRFILDTAEAAGKVQPRNLTKEDLNHK